MDGNSKQNGLNPVWKAITLNKEGKNRSIWCAEFHAVFLATVERLDSDKSSYI